ncbi:unnamed protein product [Ectocarpus sp. CCAP 1310/34]|nr:unnamed protein product [Ectocarpus sp. CCAP 1310/34]
MTEINTSQEANSSNKRSCSLQGANGDTRYIQTKYHETHVMAQALKNQHE